MKKDVNNKLIPQERSRRVIYLNKRGKDAARRPAAAWGLYVLGAGAICYCIGIAVNGFGTYFFLIWGGIGAACLGLGALVGNRKLMAAIPKPGKVAVGALVCAGAVTFCAVEGMILSEYGASAAPGADYCIVLGAQWKPSGPSAVLRKRLDKAVEYLKANPDTKVIVSGGKGANEPMAEAEGMYGYLVQAGIEEERILVEDKSRSTYENLVYSGGLLDKENDRVVIVTNNFHVFRALGIARKQNYGKVEGLAADSVLGMGPNNLLREFLGVLKDFAVGNL